ncbi:uncharacterized protein LOC121937154 [Sceloporus undulatus]|uniref:uncharacterized protein LOC121937154 n=1 Tax=Sceloporus undulatus TaxID=8520 RepID=UPI001C4CD4CC|nr:uncharacterized protein LOC121937154 [Sceloporus undulatus]
MALPVMTLLLLATYTAYINTAIHDPKTTILNDVLEFLNPEQCHEVCLTLTILPKDRLSPSQQQDISNMEQCKESLHHWLKMQRNAVDWDSLARAFRQIGRPDISRELKKRLRENRSLEPKWSLEETQTREGPRSALLCEEEAPFQSTHHKPTQKRQRTLLKEECCEPMASFLTWLSLSLHNLPKYIGQNAKLLTALSFCIILFWMLRQCFLSADTPPRDRINYIVICNRIMDENDTQDLDDSEEEEWENAEEEGIRRSWLSDYLDDLWSHIYNSFPRGALYAFPVALVIMFLLCCAT